jgi:hypothetical protein
MYGHLKRCMTILCHPNPIFQGKPRCGVLNAQALGDCVSVVSHTSAMFPVVLLEPNLLPLLLSTFGLCQGPRNTVYLFFEYLLYSCNSLLHTVLLHTLPHLSRLNLHSSLKPLWLPRLDASSNTASARIQLQSRPTATVVKLLICNKHSDFRYIKMF